MEVVVEVKVEVEVEVEVQVKIDGLTELTELTDWRIDARIDGLTDWRIDGIARGSLTPNLQIQYLRSQTSESQTAIFEIFTGKGI